MVSSRKYVNTPGRGKGTPWENLAGCSFLVLPVWIVVLLCAPASPRAAHAQSAPPRTDTLRGLVVLVRFADDTTAGDPAVLFRGWPRFPDPSTLPAFARSLLAPASEPPFPDSSLTAYFFHQSHGRLLLYGDVIDSVLVTRHPEAHYHRPQGGFGTLTQEILDRLDAGGVDFRRYDANRDGYLDHLFVILRHAAHFAAGRYRWSGVSCLDARCGPGPAGGGPSRLPAYDDVQVDWNTSGSILLHRTPGNILPHYYLVRLMAHEFGHDLWAPYFNHIAPIRDNDVPARCNRSARGTDCLGYVLMAGAGGAWDTRGAETISAFERDLLGWIACPRLTSGDHLVGDLYTTGACFRHDLRGSLSGRTLYVENRQRIGPFDRRRRAGRHAQYEAGLLRTTGLLVSLRDGYRLDVLPADGDLDLTIHDSTYAGDLFGPGASTQLTPWTRPNSNGFMHYPPGYRPDWFALDAIRHAGTTDGALTFTFIDDFRVAPVIREDSWIGAETGGRPFTGPVRVTNGSTLTLEAPQTFSRMMHLDAGTTVVVAPEGSLQVARGGALVLRRGARLIVQGRLYLEGLLALTPGAVLVVEGEGRIGASRTP
ncbi:MAG: hypothetical protein KatS3mg044_0036 [Rhodothermaceae bacterium]|nr:MAG: hypothetical protein KatS3mg044_0036 [Rhodothermaceae bacterium]